MWTFLKRFHCQLIYRGIILALTVRYVLFCANLSTWNLDFCTCTELNKIPPWFLCFCASICRFRTVHLFLWPIYFHHRKKICKTLHKYQGKTSKKQIKITADGWWDGGVQYVAVRIKFTLLVTQPNHIYLNQPCTSWMERQNILIL